MADLTSLPALANLINLVGMQLINQSQYACINKVKVAELQFPPSLMLVFGSNISMTIYLHSHVPYTYRIKWSSTGMNYYGVKTAKNCHPDGFWKTYFTSSKRVYDYIKTHGNPDIIEIRKTFTGPDAVNKARQWEIIVLSRLKAPIRQDYLNKGIPTTVNINGGWNKGLTKHTCPSIKRMSLKVSCKLKGRNATNDPGRLDAALKLKGRTKHTHAYIARQAQSMIGRTKENDPIKAQTGQKISLTMTGRTKHTHAHLAARSEKYANTYEITLPHKSIILVKHIKQWCLDNNLNINNVRSACRLGSWHKGYFFKNLGKL